MDEREKLRNDNRERCLERERERTEKGLRKVTKSLVL